MFVIDGYNLLHVVLKAEEASGIANDLGLCRILSRYLVEIGTPAVIIFDGPGPPDKSGFDNLGNLEVLFAGLGADADSAIEDKISASTAPKRLDVVSNDRRLRKAARGRK